MCIGHYKFKVSPNDAIKKNFKNYNSKRKDDSMKSNEPWS